METMKEITVNINGMGGMTLFRASRALKDESQIGHDIVVTSGEDGVVYLTDLTTESVVSETVMCDGAVPAVAVTPEQTHLLVVQEEDNALYSYALPTSSNAPQLDALLFRSTVAIRHVVCSPTYIAIADEEAKVKVLVRAAPAAEQLISIDGHSHGIKSVAIDPTDTFVCSSSEDGTVRVFELDATARTATERAVFKTQYADMSDDDVVCRCAWQRGSSPTLLAVPANQGVIELFSRTTWLSVGQLLLPIGKSTPADINIVAFSPNGLYVAAATLAKQVIVWSVATRDVLRTFTLDYHVLALEWALSQNALVAFHTGGKFGFVKDVIAIGRTPPQVLSHAIGISDNTTTSETAATSTIAATTAVTKKRKAAVSAFMDDEAAVASANSASDDDDDDNETRVEAIKASFGFGQAAADAANASSLLDDDVDTDTNTSVPMRYSSSSAVSQVVSVEPFQSGSVTDSTSAVCLLAWTPVGEIETIRGASGRENVVRVEFADKARRGFKFSDPYVFTIASLDDHGAVFGAPRRARDTMDDWSAAADNGGSDITSSYVFYRPFESWASNSSWHLALPDSEDAEVVAAARTFVAVATSLHCLRIYTTSGVEYALLRLPGRVVTMAARGSLLAVVYHEPFSPASRLVFELLDVHVSAATERVKTLVRTRIPLSPPPVDVLATHKENELARADPTQWSTLTWLGLDDRGVVYTVDSLGCVQALSASVGHHWFPIGCVANALTRKPRDRTGVFALGVVHDALLYFPLERGAAAPKLRGKHRPVPLAFPLRTAAFPKTVSGTGTSTSGTKKAADASATANVMWQNVRVHALEAMAAGVENVENVENTDLPADAQSVIVHEHAEMDKALILMMKTACANDEPARVLDLAKCLHLAKSHQIAQKLAIHFGLRQLQSELYKLYYRVFEAPQLGRDDHADRDREDRRPQSQMSQMSQMSNLSSQNQTQARAQDAPLLRASLEGKALLSRRVAPKDREGDADAAAETASYSDRSATQDDGDGDDGSTQATQASSTSFFGRSGSTMSAGATSSSSSNKPVVERSVAPANPFLKKSDGGGDAGGNDERSGLGRLAKFSSPPPMKKRKAGWK